MMGHHEAGFKSENCRQAVELNSRGISGAKRTRDPERVNRSQ